ncbi:chitin binding domain-containing protein [Rickettsia rhipicephali str. 3-7-female6-CWPP]|uniref:Chitin binding domain-containing protein n=1 Tax=Rickettsia rhipicephali (strain 3-7-female6-CWPP) TaxID=1105113 RepID=A0AAI8F6J2_RICR3|nr:hypothetical protein [Rickettsia rhipicephali]AFC72399.1 chitin binding domain-containing protein [Rickettsia rhipicephali str. 3-7-female6-CWPP]
MKNEEQHNQPTPKHGRIIFPLYTMGKVCVDKKLIDEEWKLNEFETGKGSDERFGNDVAGEPLPLDGHILNCGRTDDTDWVNATNEEIRAELKDPTFYWINCAIPLEGEKKLTIEWDYTASHKTRGYLYSANDKGRVYL